MIEQFGAIAASDWINPVTYRKRKIPQGCREILASQVEKLTGRARERAEALLRARPKVRKIIIHITP